MIPARRGVRIRAGGNSPKNKLQFMKKIFSTLFFLLAGMTAFAQTLTVDGIKIVPGASSQIEAKITGATQFIAAGMSIEIPESMTFVYDDEEESYIVGGSVFAKSHSVADKLQSSQVIKFAATSMKNDAFKKDEGTLFTVTINCGAGVDYGNYTGKVKGIEFSNSTEAGGGLFTMEDIEFNIEVTTADAIEAINAEDANISEVYSVSGAQQNTLQKGVNIVKYANGEVKKVVVK